jgi:hypothetical protein
MTRSKRPVSILIVACLYLVVGALGFAAHFRELLAGQRDSILIEITECMAIVCGVFLLPGRNWARWFALGWIAFHVILSAFHSTREMAMHGLICAAIAWLLFRPATNEYFRPAATEPT